VPGLPGEAKAFRRLKWWGCAAGDGCKTMLHTPRSAKSVRAFGFAAKTDAGPIRQLFLA